MLVQVWRNTAELSPFRAHRFCLILTDELAIVFRALAGQALDVGIDPTAWIHRCNHYSAELVSEKAYDRIKLLEFQSEIARLSTIPSVGSIPLIATSDGLVHDPAVLPLLPPRFDHFWTNGPLADKPRPRWSKFFCVSFETSQTLLRQAGPSGGIYQFWLSRTEEQPDGTFKKVLMTELYVGSAVGQSSLLVCAMLHWCWCHANTVQTLEQLCN